MLYKDWHAYQCPKNATVFREGKWYCRIHDPVYKTEKWEKRKELEYLKEKAETCKKCDRRVYGKPYDYNFCPYCGNKY